MSSHREAPGISKDPVADSTDLYAFTSPDRPDMVTLIANYIPLEGPDGGPNFYNFGDDVLYEINVTNGGSVADAITYQFKFTTEYTDPNTFLYNTGVITSLTSSSWNVRQFYSVTRIQHGTSHVLASRLACPPVNVGVRSTPKYAALAQAAVHPLNGGWVFAGQRREGFYVDLGSIFDLGALRPFQNLHLIPLPAVGGVDSSKQLNVHTIAIQIPKTQLTPNGTAPTDETSADSVIGVYTTASRRKSTVLDSGGRTTDVGPWVQVSRLGMPLINEVVIPIGKKDFWNSTEPSNDFAVRGQLRPSRACRTASGAVPRRLPAPRRVLQASRRSRGDPADRHSGGDHPWLSELDRIDPGRPAPPEHGDPTGLQAEYQRHPRRRPCRLPQRPASVRRRRDHRDPGNRRSHDPARRLELHTRRRRRSGE